MVLEQQTDAAAAHSQLEDTCADRVEPRDGAEQAALTRTVGTDDPPELSPPDLDVDRPDQGRAAALDDQTATVNEDQRLSHASSRRARLPRRSSS